jgi:prepilin signal peptidase PulO-like enzyme (type II secretory pathway)
MIILFYLFIGMISSVIINYFADTLPFTHRLSGPVCYHCCQSLTGSQYWLGKSCKECNHRHAFRYWFIILFSIAVSITCGLNPSIIKMPYWVWMVLFTYLTLIVVIDMENRLVLHSTSLIGAIVGLIFGIRYNGIVPTLIGGAVSFGIMLVLYIIGGIFGKWLAKKKNREYDDALGFGDVNLAGIAGLLVGWPAIVGGLGGAIIAGGLCSLIILLVMLAQKKYEPMLAIPYAPFIVLATVVILLMQVHI